MLGDYGCRSRMLIVKALALVVLLSAARPCDAVSISWKAVTYAGQAIPVFRNSHSTAMASLIKYHGINKQNESDKPLVATCWMYAQYCECDKPGKPTIWRVMHGLKKLFTARGYPNTPTKERCRYSSKSSEKAGWNDYVAAIKDNRPVILTFCYDPDTRQGLAPAKRREEKCFSMLGIGYMEYGDQKLLICHDGITSNQSYPASVDRVSAANLGINTQDKPWEQSGTSLYKWEGSYENLVMVFVGRPAK